MAKTVLQVEGLRTRLETRWGVADVVDGVSFSLSEGETLGIVGESGSGKTMTALSLVRLLPRPAARIVSGRILLDGDDLVPKSPREMSAIRGRDISMILQDPHTSLNPAFMIGDQLLETLRMDAGLTGDLRQAAIESLRRVQVADPERRLNDFPHQMSGGMKQRVVGAIALARSPRVLIADEPTTALDVTIQAQYLALLKELQAASGLSIIFVTHDFGVVAHMCDRVAVMYAGRIVEEGPVRDLFNKPSHPYTQALLASVPRVEERVDELYQIEGQPPSLYESREGCSFAPRCPYADERCWREYPPNFAVGDAHSARCWRLESPASRVSGLGTAGDSIQRAGLRGAADQAI